MPKNSTFYNPREHQKIIKLLEEGKPKLIIAITDRNPCLAGGMYPFPLIEDGDFNIPSVYMTKKVGQFVLANPDAEIYLEMESIRISSTGKNVIAHIPGECKEKIVITSHLDTKKNTPSGRSYAFCYE